MFVLGIGIQKFRSISNVRIQIERSNIDQIFRINDCFQCGKLAKRLIDLIATLPL